MGFPSVPSLSFAIFLVSSGVTGQHAVPHLRRDNATTSSFSNSSAAATITSAPASTWTDTVLFCDNLWSTSGSSSKVTGSTCKNSCVASWNDYMKSLGSVQYNYNYTTTTSTYTYHNITASITTACDGHPRIVGDLTTLATGTNVTVTSGTPTTYEFTKTTPACVLAPSDCTSFYGMYGSSDMSQYCTNTEGLSCGTCRIAGGTVQLIYFPPATPTTTVNLCPNPTISPGSATECPLGPTLHSLSYTNPYDDPGCDYALPNKTSTPETAQYVVSDGNTFYHDKVYISLATVIATNDCGRVGSDLPATLLTLHSSDIYSIGGYHHAFADVGYSFNFNDLAAPPSYAYYMNCDGGGGIECSYYGTRYTYGLDWLNGVQTLDLGNANLMQNPNSNGTNDAVIWSEAYSPILLAPLQLRMLQPAWSNCALDLGGLYDPPKALTEVLTEAGPSGPAGYSSTSAVPASSLSNTLASATAEPVNTATPTTSAQQQSSAPVASIPPTQSTSQQPESTSVPADSPSVQPVSSSVQPGPSASASPSPAGGASGSSSDSPKPSPDSTAASLNPGSQPQASQTTSTTQGIGGVIASVLGMTASSSAAAVSSATAQAPSQTSEANPTVTSGVLAKSATASLVVTFTDSAGSTQTAVVPQEALTSITKSLESATTPLAVAFTDSMGSTQTAVFPQSALASYTEAAHSATTPLVVTFTDSTGSTQAAVVPQEALTSATGSANSATTPLLVTYTNSVGSMETAVVPQSAIASFAGAAQSATASLIVTFTDSAGSTQTAVITQEALSSITGSAHSATAPLTVTYTNSAGSTQTAVIPPSALASLATQSQSATESLAAVFTDSTGSTQTVALPEGYAPSSITGSSEPITAPFSVTYTDAAGTVQTTVVSQGSLTSVTGLPQTAAQPFIITYTIPDGSTHTATLSHGGIIIGSSMFISMGGGMTVSGTTVSAAPSAVFVCDHQTTETVTYTSMRPVTASAGSPIIARQTTSTNPAPVATDTTFTETYEAMVTVATSTYLVQALSSSTAVAIATYGAILSVGSSTYIVEAMSNSTGALSIAGQTISAGGSAIVIDGVTISDATGGVVVQGTSTVPLSLLSSIERTSSAVTSTSSQVTAAGTSVASSSSVTRTSAAVKTSSGVGSAGMLVMVAMFVYMII